MKTMKQLRFSVTALVFLLFPLLSFASGEQVVDITIEGMTCKFCAYGVQKNLLKLPNIANAEVDIDSKKAHIVMNAGTQADIEQIKKKITEAGFKPVTVTVSKKD